MMFKTTSPSDPWVEKKRRVVAKWLLLDVSVHTTADLPWPPLVYIRRRQRIMEYGILQLAWQ